MMFSGFTSRWIIPAEWAAESADGYLRHDPTVADSDIHGPRRHFLPERSAFHEFCGKEMDQAILTDSAP